jgi:KipI family sensor histidine kinase inhibitor
LPGFAYLGGLDKRIHTPRLKTPRTRIPPGSVGIGGEQTGIYPIASPGGWQLIGRTPVKPYDPKRALPILFEAGDFLKFVPINEEMFRMISAQVEAGKYKYRLAQEGWL